MARGIAIFLFFGLAASAQEPDAEQIVRRSLERDIFNSKQARNYTFVQEVEEKHLDEDGNVKRTKTETSEIVMLYGEPHERLIRRDGKPLLPAEKRKLEEKLNRVIEKRSKETEMQKAKRLTEAEKERRKSREFLQRIPEAFILRLIGEETLWRARKHGLWKPRRTPSSARTTGTPSV